MLTSTLFFKYVLLSFFQSSLFFFLKSNCLLNRSSYNLIISPQSYEKFFLIFKSSSFFSNNQSVEQFGFKNNLANLSAVINIFFILNMFSYVFNITLLYQRSSTYSTKLNSLETLFFNFWWLEREVTEMHGIKFINKSDTRNLLLDYLNFFIPMERSFPTIGLFEISFNVLVGLIRSTFLSLQF